MKMRILAGVLAGLWLLGCGPSSTRPSYSPAAGSVGISRDDALVYVADTDNGLLAVIDTRSDTKIAEVKVGRAPERIAVGPDDTIYVSNRGDRSVSVVERGSWDAPAARIEVGVEPVGLAVSDDGLTLYVVNSAALGAEHGSLMAIDTRSRQVKWELPIGKDSADEPRGIALVEGNKALVSLFKRGDVVLVDLDAPAVVKNGTEVYERANASRPSATSGSSFPTRSRFSSFHPRAAADVTATPDGKRAFVPVVWAREDAIATRPNVAGGYYAAGGPCNVGAIATAGVVTFEAQNADPKVDDLTSCSFATNPENRDYPASTLGSPNANTPIQAPTVAVVEPTGAWLFVVNRESRNLAVVPTEGRSGDGIDFNTTGSSVRLDALVPVGHGANGLALTRDGKKAYVYSAFDHRLDVVKRVEDPKTGLQSLQSVKSLSVTNEVLPPEIASGRRMFFDAADLRMSARGTGTACATCHLEGRDDAHTWNFPDGPRQTPSLAGRKTLATGPYHWSGEFRTIADFLDHTIKARMGGVGLSAELANHLGAFVEWMPAPDNPFRQTEPSEAQKRGAHVFQKAECSTCHAGLAFTNNTFADVGTLVLSGPNPDDRLKLTRGLNTPSLLTLSRTAPYLHDGSAGTLKQRLLAGKDRDLHGKTSQLTDQEMNDLVEFLRAL